MEGINIIEFYQHINIAMGIMWIYVSDSTTPKIDRIDTRYFRIIIIKN